MEELLKIRAEYQQKVDDINTQMHNYADGFKYVVVIHSYGSHYKTHHNNHITAIEMANEYYQDNGFADIYTNNKDFPETCLLGGNIYYYEDIDNISQYKHPEDSVILWNMYNPYEEYDYNNYEEYDYDYINDQEYNYDNDEEYNYDNDEIPQ